MTLLSRARLDAFRELVRMKQGAEFLAPQLPELITVLTRELKNSTGTLESTRTLLAELATTYDESVRAGDVCSICQDARLRTVSQQLRILLGDER